MGGDLGVFPEPQHYRRPEGVKKVGFVGDSGSNLRENLLDRPGAGFAISHF